MTDEVENTEQEKMSVMDMTPEEQVNAFISAAEEEDYVTAQDMFRHAISDKLQDVLDQQKAYIAQEIYGEPAAEEDQPQPEDPVDTDVVGEVEMDPELEKFINEPAEE